MRLWKLLPPKATHRGRKGAPLKANDQTPGLAAPSWRTPYACSPTDTTHQRPEDVDGKEGDGEGNEPYSLQPAMEPEVVLGSTQAQPARDGSQRRDEQETYHVTAQRPLLCPRPWVLQPLQGSRGAAEMATHQPPTSSHLGMGPPDPVPPYAESCHDCWAL